MKSSKKLLSVILAMIIIALPALPAFALEASNQLEGFTLVTELSDAGDIPYRVTIRQDGFIGRTENKIDIKSLNDYLFTPYSSVVAVYLLEEGENSSNISVTFQSLPDDGADYYFGLNWSLYPDEPEGEYGVCGTYGEYWSSWGMDEGFNNNLIGPGNDTLLIAHDGGGQLDVSARILAWQERTFQAYEGVRFQYFNLAKINKGIWFGSPQMILTPAMADEILETGSFSRYGITYPVDQYFPDVKQMILNARAGIPPAFQDDDENETLAANPTASTVLVNGENAAFDAYNINGNNYFKLRDLAYILNGTEKQFEVGYDGAANAISLTSNQSYTTVGGEMTGKGDGAKTPAPTDSKILLNGSEIQFTAYNIDGNNYFKLRDIGQAFDFGVDWDGEQNSIVIDTSKGYTGQ